MRNSSLACELIGVSREACSRSTLAHLVPPSRAGAEVCTYPGIIISGTMSSVKFYYSVHDSITYTCSDGLLLHGEHTITCQEGGRWSAPVPTCLPTP